MSCLQITIAEFVAAYRPQGVDPARLAIISLGANLPSRFGAPEKTLEQAAARLSALSQWPVVLSPMLVTEPVDCPPGSPPFCNAVVVLDPGDMKTPEQLLDELKVIENDIGRVRTGVRNQPRVLDLDLIAFGNALRDTPELTLPHPRAAQRAFVLEPLVAIWPDYLFPGRFPGMMCDASQLLQQTRSPA